jgi:hypothetical protein
MNQELYLKYKAERQARIQEQELESDYLQELIDQEKIRLSSIKVKRKKKEKSNLPMKVKLKKEKIYLPKLNQVEKRTPEQRKEKNKRYAEKHKEKIKEKAKQYYLANKERINKNTREWMLANPEKVLVYKKKCREKTKEKKKKD